MERFMKELSKDELKVYLIVNEQGVTQNVCATVGLAIDAISYNARRLEREAITKLTYTQLEWTGRDGKAYSLKVMECTICKDVTVDYMYQPRPFNL